MSTPAYPQPTVTSTNRPLIEGWQRGELMLQHCEDCKKVIFFPRHNCPHCWSTRLAWQRSKGQGTIVSFARVYKHVSEPFGAEAPTTLAEIALADGVGMIARVITADVESIASGMRVELVTMPDAARYPLPTFQVAK